MGLFGDDDGKTEKPTPQRLSEVRNRGDSPLSRELIQGGLLVVAAVLALACGDWFVGSLCQLLERGLNVGLQDRALHNIPGACVEMGTAVMTVLAPFALLLGSLFVAAIVLGYGQIGMKFANEVLGVKWEKVNPFTNYKRLFNVQGITRAVAALVKLAVILGVLWVVLGNRLPTLLHLHEQPLRAAAREIGELTVLLLLWVGVVVFVLAFADFAWQRYQFEKRNMMTRQEVEDERKRSDGDPAIKMRQRRARQELLRHRMMADVPKADVIIINPTHFSVALRYDRKRDAAPTVVAKGLDELALRIRELAKEHGVPLLEDPPLARALYRAVKVGQSIPDRFFQAVAVVLSHVYRIKGKSA